MSESLHILNGDSTLLLFNKTHFQGDTFVWKEVLSEGPVHPEFASEQFWREREAFMSQYFSLDKGRYQRETILPFKELESKISTYQDITLWFEYDLFCQINMMSLIYWLKGVRVEGQTISMVCSGKIEGSEKLLGLGELSIKQFEDQYNNRLKLNTREFEFASDIYHSYTSPDLSDLFTYMLMPSDEFIYLAEAISTHLKRIPSSSSGLTEIEHQMLSFIQEGVKDDGELIGKMLKWQVYYGFGDLQYFKKLKDLSPLFEDFDTLKLKSEPELSNAINGLNRNYHLGGVKVANWVYNEGTKEVENAPYKG